MALPVDEHFIHHCEIQPDDEDGAEATTLMYTKCKKDHKGFIPVTQFGQDDLPVEWRTDEKMAMIRNRIDRTVHISVAYTSKKRPDTFIDSETKYPCIDFRGCPRKWRHGTGYIRQIMNHVTSNHCICPECQESDTPKTESWVVYVITATHVIYDTSEAKVADVELFYDSDDRKGVVFLHGRYVMGDRTTRCYTDHCYMACVTHDRELANRLKEMCSFNIESPSNALTSAEMLRRDGDPCILISHPHGVSKMISIGRMYYWNFILDRAAESIALPKGCPVKLPCADAQTKDMQDDGHGDTKGALKSDSISGSKQSTSQHSLTESLDDNSQLLHTIYAIPPKRAKFHCRFLLGTMNMTFPKGTKFVTESGIEVSSFPPTTEFALPFRGVEWEYQYGEYDITSCPGSSGAMIFDFSTCRLYGLHFGTNEGNKVSGLTGNMRNELFRSNMYHDDFDGDDSTNGYTSRCDADKKSTTNKIMLRNERMRRAGKRRARNVIFKDKLKKFMSRRSGLETMTVRQVINALIDDSNKGLLE